MHIYIYIHLLSFQLIIESLFFWKRSEVATTAAGYFLIRVGQTQEKRTTTKNAL